MDIGYILNEARTRGLTTCEIMLWIALAHVADQLGSTFAASSYDLEKITGMSRTSLLRSRQALRDEGIITYEVHGRHPAIYTLRGEIVVRSRLDEKPEIQGKTEDVVRSRLDRGEIEPFSPHTPLNPKRNNIYSTYSSSRKEDVRDTENITLGIEVTPTSTESSNATIESKPKKPKPEAKKFGEFVSMTDTEFKMLTDRFGEGPAREMIEALDNYKGSSGRRYKSDYRAILSWVVKRYEEDCTRSHRPIPYRQKAERRYDNPHDFFEGGGV